MRFTADEERTMARMWSEGRTCDEIADAVGRSRGTVTSWASCHRDLCPRRRRALTPALRREILDMRRKGIGNADIARRLGLSPSTVSRSLEVSARCTRG